MQLDDIDTHLIGLLRQNARASIADIARQIGIARTTVQARIDRLERSGVIQGYTLRLNANQHTRLRATALVAIEPRSGPAVLHRLNSLTAVEVVYTTSGRFDLLVEIIAQTTEELDQTLDRIGEIKGVRSSESLIHLSTKLDRR